MGAAGGQRELGGVQAYGHAGDDRCRGLDGEGDLIVLGRIRLGGGPQMEAAGEGRSGVDPRGGHRSAIAFNDAPKQPLVGCVIGDRGGEGVGLADAQGEGFLAQGHVDGGRDSQRDDGLGVFGRVAQGRGCHVEGSAAARRGVEPGGCDGAAVRLVDGPHHILVVQVGDGSAELEAVAGQHCRRSGRDGDDGIRWRRSMVATAAGDEGAE